MICVVCCFFVVQAEDGIRDLVRSRGLGDVYKRQVYLMKNFILGVDFKDNNNFIEKNRRRTLYYTAEQSADYFILVCAQILEGCTRGYAFEHKNELLDKWLSLIHI